MEHVMPQQSENILVPLTFSFVFRFIIWDLKAGFAYGWTDLLHEWLI